MKKDHDDSLCSGLFGAAGLHLAAERDVPTLEEPPVLLLLCLVLDLFCFVTLPFWTRCVDEEHRAFDEDPADRDPPLATINEFV